MRRPARELREGVSESVWLRLGQGMARCVDHVADDPARGHRGGRLRRRGPRLHGQRPVDPDARASCTWRASASASARPRPASPSSSRSSPTRRATCVASALAAVGGAVELGLGGGERASPRGRRQPPAQVKRPGGQQRAHLDRAQRPAAGDGEAHAEGGMSARGRRALGRTGEGPVIPAGGRRRPAESVPVGTRMWKGNASRRGPVARAGGAQHRPRSARQGSGGDRGAPGRADRRAPCAGASAARGSRRGGCRRPRARGDPRRVAASSRSPARVACPPAAGGEGGGRARTGERAASLTRASHWRVARGERSRATARCRFSGWANSRGYSWRWPRWDRSAVRTPFAAASICLGSPQRRPLSEACALSDACASGRASPAATGSRRRGSRAR